ncbi:MAG: GNAT family N-acetyltransferase [Maribacter sp.]
MDIRYANAQTTDELLQILSLQKMNLKTLVSAAEMAEEGFVTVEHDFDLLKRMNDACAHIIAKDGDKVVGYALSMTSDFKDEITVLRPMFDELESMVIKNFITMGQICIAKSHRKMGIFKGLYAAMKQFSHPKYAYIVTEVDATNKRSLGAHYAAGFEKVCIYHSFGQDWELIALKTY